MKIGLLDYGSGNLHSAARALDAAGADVTVTGDPAVLAEQSGLVVPGVGAFSACMDGLDAAGANAFILDWVAAGKPLLGICVGHQVLFSYGLEGGHRRRGLGLFDGDIGPLDAAVLPHMGWNTVEAPPESRLFRGIDAQQFYFVHSYAATIAVDGALNTWTRHENSRFIAAIERDNLASTQFHPEKSGSCGVRLLRNWMEYFIG